MSAINNAYDGVHWYEGSDLTIGGMAWRDEQRVMPYDRLPASLQPQISEALWGLGTHPAGVYIAWEGAATELYARWQLVEPLSDGDKANRMSQAGLDCYGRDHQGRWRWVGSRSPWQAPNCDGSLSYGPLDGVFREYRAYLPKHSRISGIQIGSRSELTP